MENSKFRVIICGMEEKLRLLDGDNENFQNRIIAAINLCASTYNELREFVLKHGLKTQADEIYFFKVVKPLVYGKLLYYIEIYYIEAKRPIVNLSLQQEYFAGIQKKIHAFFDEYREFYSYYRSGSSLFDNHFFVRGQTDTFLATINTRVITYPEFNTSHDYVLSKIKAFELVLQYIDHEIKNIIRKGIETDKIQKVGIETDLFWTENKVSLIELIYALHSSGAINKGKFDIKHLSTIFEKIFHIELGNIYRSFTEIRIRKKERTKFLDYLRDRLLNKMDEDD